MYIKEFNREYSILANGKTVLGQEDEMQLHCLLTKTVSALGDDDLNEQCFETTILLSNIHDIVLKSKANPAIIWACVEALNKTILANKNKALMISRLRILPILADVLIITSAQNKIEYLLNLIESITFGIEIKICEPFMESLIRVIIQFITDEKSEYDKFRKTALSILINICGNSLPSLSILSQEINLVDFQKIISIGNYGILACKMNLILNNCGHLLTDADVRNFLKFTSKEVLKCISSQDEMKLKHLIEFLKDVSSRQNTRHILKEYNFHLALEGAIMLLDKQDSNEFSKQISSLFEIINTILEAKNQSMKNIELTVLDFSLKHLKTAECCIQSLRTITLIFDMNPNINTASFEMSDLKNSLQEILSNHDYKPHIMIPLLKLLVVLGITYEVNLINNAVLNTILAPLIKPKNIQYSKLKTETITMYLQCLVTLLKLSEFPNFDLKVGLLNEKNVQYIVGMSIKNGNKDQCALSLELLKSNHFSANIIAEMITDHSFEQNDIIDGNPSNINNNQLLPSGNFNNSRRNEFSDEKYNKIFHSIKQACDENKLNQLSVTDFIELYEHRNFTLNQRLESMTNKLMEMSNEITMEKHNSIRSESAVLKCTELAKTLQRSNEILTEDKQSMCATLIKTKAEFDLLRDDHQNTIELFEKKIHEFEKRQDANIKKLFDLQNTLKEKNSTIEGLENDLKETENLRHTIISLVQPKRKK